MQWVPSDRGFILGLEVAGKANRFAHRSWSREASGQAHSTGHPSLCIVGEMSMVLPNTVFMRNLTAAGTLQPLVGRDTRVVVSRGAGRAKTTPGGMLPGIPARVWFDSTWWWIPWSRLFTTRPPGDWEMEACKFGFCAQRPKQDSGGRSVRVSSTVKLGPERKSNLRHYLVLCPPS